MGILICCLPYPFDHRSRINFETGQEGRDGWVDCTLRTRDFIVTESTAYSITCCLNCNRQGDSVLYAVHFLSHVIHSPECSGLTHCGNAL